MNSRDSYRRGMRDWPREVTPSALRLLAILLCCALLVGCAAGRQSQIHQPTPESGANPPRNEPLISTPPLPGPAEELWVIEKSPAAVNATGEPVLSPGSGMLLAHKGNEMSPFPLQHTDIHASIRAFIASVEVAQQFANPTKHTVEAVYVFPLPETAAVSEFVMSIGTRHIRGVIRERHEAEQIYHAAREQGYLASLMVQQTPNVFVQRVANVEPGRQIDVNVRYFQTVAYADGWFEFRLPMISGPRGMGFPKSSQRSGRDVAVHVDLDATVPIQRIESGPHRIEVRADGANRAHVELAGADRIANSDFILRYEAGGGEISSTLLTEPDGDGGTFALMLLPPESAAGIARKPLEVIIALDGGKPAVAAAESLLHLLKPEDTFQIGGASASGSHALMAAPSAATPTDIATAHGALAGAAAAAPETGAVIRTAMEMAHDPGRERLIVLLSDGQAPPARTICAIQAAPDRACIATVCVGPSPNRYGLEAIARAAHGPLIDLPGGDDAQAFAKLLDRISHPVLSDITLDADAIVATDTLPHRLPDLFAGHAIYVVGRYHGPAPSAIKLSAQTNGGRRDVVVPVRTVDGLPGRSALASLWARQRIGDLAAQSICRSDPQVDSQMRQLALEYGLLSPQTSFITVDSLSRVSENAAENRRHAETIVETAR